MKTTVLSLLLAGCLVALAAWLVHLDDVNALKAQGGEPKKSEPREVPEKYRATVQKGLAYLVKNQFKDGHWEGDGGKHPVAMTSLAGLALLMEKQRGRGKQTEGPEPRYSSHVRQAADWLMDRSKAKRDGLIFSEHPSETARYMQGHGLATLFLAGAGVDEPDGRRGGKLNDILIRAVKYIGKAQSTRGGWYHTSRVEGHDFDAIATTVIQIQALQAAENVGVPIPDDVVNDAQEYLKMALGKYEEAKTGQRLDRQADIAAALACRFRTNLGQPRGRGDKDEWYEKWFNVGESEIPIGRNLKFGRDELTHYYFAQAQYQVGGDEWTRYRTAMFDHLQSSQNKDGSWPASDGISVGPVYATALWCTILQLDMKSHPSMRWRVEAIK